jgi:hypothetical protein
MRGSAVKGFYEKDLSVWLPWFAWHPVRINGKRVWGRWVERALLEEYHTGPLWRYR